MTDQLDVNDIALALGMRDLEILRLQAECERLRSELRVLSEANARPRAETPLAAPDIRRRVDGRPVDAEV